MIAVVILLILIGVIRDNNTKTNQLRKVQSELQTLQVEAEKLDEALKKEQHIEHKNDKKVDELLEQKKIREKKIDDLIRQLQAKRKGNIAYASPEPVRRAETVSGGSGCEWLKGRLAANGVSASDMPAAINIARVESGCNSAAVNPSSGACNVFQELACGKWGGRSDVDAHIRGAIGYANARYGGWWGAWKSWQTKHWW